jgi:hypothetical protein
MKSRLAAGYVPDKRQQNLQPRGPEAAYPQCHRGFPATNAGDWSAPQHIHSLHGRAAVASAETEYDGDAELIAKPLGAPVVLGGSKRYGAGQNDPPRNHCRKETSK